MGTQWASFDRRLIVFRVVKRDGSFARTAFPQAVSRIRLQLSESADRVWLADTDLRQQRQSDERRNKQLRVERTKSVSINQRAFSCRPSNMTLLEGGSARTSMGMKSAFSTTERISGRNRYEEKQAQTCSRG